MSVPESRFADARARSTEWADPGHDRIAALVRASQELGWREALAGLPEGEAFFATRLRNLALGNWHLLLGLPAESRAADVGCGFGSLALGLASYYRSVTGVDALWSRLAYAALRARQEGRGTLALARANALDLPFRDGCIDLLTMNGVLEWAGLYADGAPGALQVAALREARRVLSPGGTLAVAIENRYAMESLAGMPDTHTGLRLVTALPRLAADGWSRLRRGQPYRTYLYGLRGYRALLRRAGFARTRALDLVSSYNDYDFVVAPEDRTSYRLLWRRGVVRSFYERAARARRALARGWPALLGRLSYAYLLVAGGLATTLLDADDPLWRRAASVGVSAARARFACQGREVGSIVLVAHDGERVASIIDVRAGPAPPADDPALPERLAALVAADELRPAGAWRQGALSIRSFTRASG